MATRILDDGNYWIIKCPGCYRHYIPKGKGWAFDGNTERPTISPSLLTITNATDHPYYQPDAETTRCHLFVRSGKLELLSDCTHPFAGQTVDMEGFTQEEIEQCTRRKDD